MHGKFLSVRVSTLRCWFIITAYQNVACGFKKCSHHLRAILNIKCHSRFISSWVLEHSQFTALKHSSVRLTIRGCVLEEDGCKPDSKTLWLRDLNQGDRQGGLKKHLKSTGRQLQESWYFCCLSEKSNNNRQANLGVAVRGEVAIIL